MAKPTGAADQWKLDPDNSEASSVSSGTGEGQSDAQAQDKGSGTSEQRRRELADFLRTRRERLKPEHVGITQVARRRTPGLRREEVAELAGVGTTWYTWLEQARDIQPSAEVLRRLGLALKMSPTEMRHMFALAGKAPPPEEEPEVEVASDSLLRIVHHALQVPVILLGSRWDVLAINDHAIKAFPSGQYLAGKDIEPEQRNWLRFYFSPQSTVRQDVLGWEPAARRLIAEFRASMSGMLESAWVQKLIDELRKDSPEFAQWWPEHDVRDEGMSELEVMHTELGVPIRYERSVLRPATHPKFKLIVYTPVK